MSDVGFMELLVLFAIGLVVLGPERLPQVANKIGRWVGQARRMTRVMKRQLEDELNFEKDFDMTPPARTRHSDPGGWRPSTPAATQSGTPEETEEPANLAATTQPDERTGAATDDAATSADADGTAPDDDGKGQA